MIIKTTQNLSKSIKCNWVINKDEPPATYKIISVVYFSMEKNYKSNDIYYLGLEGLINTIPKVLPDFRLRIYYDDTTEEQVKKLTLNKTNIELFKYSIPKLKNKGYHYGVVGTLIRFLPLYDNNIHKVDCCIILDIDNVLHDWYESLFNYLLNNKTKFAYRSRACYSMEKRIQCTKTNSYAIIASFIYQTINLPFNIFSDFLEDTYINNKLTNYIKKCGLEDKYSYGIDELFMNDYHLNYLYKNNIQIAAILFNHHDILVGLVDYIYNLTTKEQLHIYLDFLIKICNILKLSYNLNSIKDKLNDSDITLIKEEIRKEIRDNDTLWENNRKKIFYFINKHNYSDIIKLLLYILKRKELVYIKHLVNCIFVNLKLDLNKINIILLDTKLEDTKKIILKEQRVKIKYRK